MITMAKPFKLNKQALGDHLQSAAVKGQLRALAEKTKWEARFRAPVETGEYRDSIHVEDASSQKWTRYRVIADDWKSAFLEDEYRTLGRSADTKLE